MNGNSNVPGPMGDAMQMAPASKFQFLKGKADRDAGKMGTSKSRRMGKSMGIRRNFRRK